MDKPTPIYESGMTIHIPDVPVMLKVKGKNNSIWYYGRCANHPVGQSVEIHNVSWANHVEQWTYSIEIDGYIWHYLESDLLIGDVNFMDGQRSLFSIDKS